MLDYLTGEDEQHQISRKQKAEQVVARLNAIVAAILEKHKHELNTANLVGLVIQRIVSSPDWSLLARFSIFRWRSSDGDNLEFLEYQWLDLVLAHDDAWRMYSRSLLAKLKSAPQSLTAAETDDILFGKGNSNRHTVSGKERKRRAHALLWDDQGNMQWLTQNGQIVRPLRESENALLERPNEDPTRNTTHVSDSELLGKFQAARMTVVPVRPNSCHLEVKLYGRYLQNPLTDITSAACFKSTVYEKMGKEGPQQTEAEKKSHLPSVTKRQNDLRLPVLSEMAVSHPRPQLADPRVVKEGQGDLITAPDRCTHMSYEAARNRSGGKGFVGTNRTYGLLRFEVVGVTIGGMIFKPPAQAYDAHGDESEAMNAFLAQVRAAAADLDAKWRGDRPPGTPLAMAWGAHALVTQKFESPAVAQEMLREVLPEGTDREAVRLVDRKTWSGHLVRMLVGANGYVVHLLYVDEKSKWDFTLGLRVHEMVTYGQSDDGGAVTENDLPPVGYNLRYVSSDGFPNTAPSDPSGFYVDAKGDRVDTVPVRIGERAVYVDSYYRGARKVFNEQTMAFEDAFDQNPANHYAPQQPPGPHQLTLWWKENNPPSSHAHTVDPDVPAAPDKQIFPPDRSVMPTLFDQHILRRATWEATRSQDAINGRGGFGAPMLERPPDGLDKLQEITWFARQIVRHVELWNTDYARALHGDAARRDEALMRLRQRPRFSFTESPHRDWLNGPKMGVAKTVKEYVQTTATEVNRRQRALRKETVKPREARFCQYELPLRRITDSSEQVYEGWAQSPGRTIPYLLHNTGFVRRDVRHSAAATPRDPTEGNMHPLGKRVEELQFAEDWVINPARNFQLHDTMHTAHATLTFRLRDDEGNPKEAPSTPAWCELCTQTGTGLRWHVVYFCVFL